MTKLYLYVRRYLTVLLVLGTLVSYAQQTVSGKVTAADDGSPIPGVNILEKGTSNGTVTSADGTFKIDVAANATLVFSFVGYTTREVSVGSQSTLNVSLQPDVTSLSEVVVIGYGEVNKRDVTGAVASIKAEDFNKGIIASPEQLIMGKTAGVQITQSSGEPGAGVNLRIRGTSSVRGGNNPLFVVDGIPLSGDNVSAGGADFGRGGSSSKNPLNFINPNDIESIDILKDASATAIYGSRGANGVVIITTKSGRGKKHTLDYNTTLSFSEQRKTYKVLNAADFLAAYGSFPGNTVSSVDYGADTDWQDEVNRTSVSHSHNLSYGTSYKTGDVRASLSYDDQEGIIYNSGMERITGRLNFNQSFMQEKLKFGAQMLFSRINDQAAPITNSAGFEGDVLASSIFYNPTIPSLATNYVQGSPTGQQYNSDAANPNSLLRYHKDVTETNRNLINLSLAYDITEQLNFKVNTGFDRSNSLRTAAMSGEQTKISNVSGFGRSYLTDQDNDSDLMELLLTYKKDIGKNSLNLLVGYSYQEFRIDGRNANAANFRGENNLDIMMQQLINADNAARAYIPTAWMQYEYQDATNMRVYDLFNSAGPTVTSYTTGLPAIAPRGVTGSKFSSSDEIQSFFARGNYNIGEKYFFTASVRADGSTKFGSNNKYGIFPSAAVKWRLSEEGFVPEVFDDLALRLGYGVTGNQEIPHNVYSGRQRYGGLGLNNDGTLGGQAGLVPLAFENPDLQWEQTSQLNFGVDFGFFNSRLNGTLDIYNKNTTKLLVQTTIASPAPTPFYWENLDANVINSGVELTLNGVVVDKQDFNFNLGFNISYNKNMVKNYSGSSLPTGAISGQGLTGAYAQRIANNQPLFSYFLREFVGFTSTGLNADDDVQKFIGKSALPKINLGFSLSARYKDFDVSAYFNGQYGHYVYNNIANAMFTKGALANGRNVPVSVVQSTESRGNSPDVSTRFLEKGDFLRLQNLSLGYSVNMNEYLIKKLRFSVIAQNIWVLTDYSGLDPEVNVDKSMNGIPSLGIDYTAYPRAKTLTFGLSATF